VFHFILATKSPGGQIIVKLALSNAVRTLCGGQRGESGQLGRVACQGADMSTAFT